MPESAVVANTFFLRAYMLFNMLRDRWAHAVQGRQHQLANGLQQLRAAQAEVDTLAQDAARSQKAVERAQALANAALAEITCKMEDVQAKQAVAGKLRAQLAEREVVITDKKN